MAESFNSIGELSALFLLSQNTKLVTEFGLKMALLGPFGNL